MNKLEFKEIIKAVGINNPLTTTTGKYGTLEEVHYWKDFAIYFSGSYYTIIRGNVPIELARSIYSKYDNKEYLIRVNGCDYSYKPDGFINFVNTYHIDTKEGLLAFLLELKDYMNKTKKEVSRYNELYTTINKRMLLKAEPTIGAYDWMQQDLDNKDTYNKIVNRDRATGLGIVFRDALDLFDTMVNPYICNDIELDSLNNILDNVKISTNVYNYKNGKKREGCCDIEFLDLATGNNTHYYRSPNGFSFQLNYKISEHEYFHFLHFFSTNGNKETDRGEVVAVDCYGNDDSKIDLRFNLTQGKAGETYSEKAPVTPEQIAIIYDKMQEAIRYAKSITIDNMLKKDMELTR